MATSTRAASPGIAAGRTGAVTIGLSALPVADALLMSAPGNIRPGSDGLTGATSMRTSTSRGPSVGISARTRDTWTEPAFESNDWS